MIIAEKVENDKQNILCVAIDDQIFFGEKFLPSCADETLYYLMLFCEKLISEFSDKLNEKTSSGIHRAILACISTPKSSLRNKCASHLKKILTALRITSYRV